MDHFAADLQRRSMSDGVFSHLRDQIISGNLAPGQKLTEQELSTMLGVSRTPIREALRLLLGEQLVEKRSSGGFSVIEVSIEDLRETYDVRALLEGLMARDATRKARPGDVAELRELLASMKGVQTDDEAVATISRTFHRRIAGIADNRWASATLAQLTGHVDRYRALAASGTRRPIESVHEHEEILDAIESGDAERAERLMRAHVEASAEPALRVLEQWLSARDAHAG